MSQLLGLSEVLAREKDSDRVVSAALPVLLDLAGATCAWVLEAGEGSPRVLARAGLDLAAGPRPPSDPNDPSDPSAAFPHADPVGLLATCPVAPGWHEAGITHAATHRLPGTAGVLLLAWRTAPGDETSLHLALGNVDTAVLRAQAEEGLADLATRVNNAQHLADMGDYDWHIASDTNTWSDQLFRIYGYEPQSFHPTYEKFISLIHPEDRDRITALHQNAYATGEPYQMIERIVRPDGSVRYLSSNGEVIMDEHGQPVRMRGTCIDITDHVHVDRERERSAARFQGLVDSAPDAILVLAEDQHVLQANQRAHALLGGDPRGHGAAELLPGWPHGRAPAVTGTGLDGRDLLLDVIPVVIETDESDPEGHRLVTIFLRDARARLEHEAQANRLGEAQLRRRQALEINDNVVQGLVAAIYAVELDEPASSSAYLAQTLSAARAMMDDLLAPLDGAELGAGDLVRASAAVIGLGPEQGQEHGERRAHPVPGDD